jgi:hypothetical protein
MNPVPGDWLYRFLLRWLSERTVRDVVEPTVADLQHEFHGAGQSRRQQWIAVWRGYGALGRALFFQSFETAAPVRTALTIGFFGLAGGALFAWARVTVKDPRIFNSAFLLPMCAAPLALRLGGGASSYRRLFAGLIAVGVLMWSVSGGPFRSTVPGPWLVRAVGALLNVTAIATLSALGAAAVWTPVSGSVPLARRLILGLLASGLTTTSLFYLSHWLERTPGVMAVMLPFYVVMFAMPIAVTSLPMLLIAHVWIRTHVGLALVGAVISPLAMLVMLYVDTGGAKEVIKCLRDAPAMCAVMTVPFTMGSGVLAWILPARRAARAAK